MTNKQIKELEENLKLTKMWIKKGNSIRQINLDLVLDDFERVLKELGKKDEEIFKLSKELEKLKTKPKKQKKEEK